MIPPLKLSLIPLLLLMLILAGIGYIVRPFWKPSLEDEVFILFLALVWVVSQTEQQIGKGFEQLLDRFRELKQKLDEIKSHMGVQFVTSVNDSAELELGKLDDLSHELDTAQEEIKSKIGALREDFENGLGGVREQFRDGLDRLSDEIAELEIVCLKADVDGIKGDLAEGIAKLKDDVRGLDSKLDELNIELGNIREELNELRAE